MEEQVYQPSNDDYDGIGYYALRLAMTRTLAEEMALKQEYLTGGLSVVVTEAGGSTKKDFQQKTSRAVLGAAMNAGLVKKSSYEIHALLHATEEAKRGAIINTSSEANLAVKIAIVRKSHWIAVAIFGESAIHPMTSHERCGLGVMNI
ncbi:HutP family protein [Anaerotruncus rubiinfantis]|jgi:hut operon positive regulator|uniref:HutP family protein n=1 Tax=Anaerotruncus rubiinfantis TaxID=1720200 RepID=UPI00082E5ACA|nr:HutP family protein [Anaerotruncus rubiinfantis]